MDLDFADVRLNEGVLSSHASDSTLSSTLKKCTQIDTKFSYA